MVTRSKISPGEKGLPICKLFSDADRASGPKRFMSRRFAGAVNYAFVRALCVHGDWFDNLFPDLLFKKRNRFPNSGFKIDLRPPAKNFPC
jgi:hypothetical protein